MELEGIFDDDAHALADTGAKCWRGHRQECLCYSDEKGNLMKRRTRGGVDFLGGCVLEFRGGWRRVISLRSPTLRRDSGFRTLSSECSFIGVCTAFRAAANG